MSEPRGKLGALYNILSYPFKRAPVLTAGVTDQAFFGGAGLNAIFSNVAEKGAEYLGIDPNIIKAALPTAVGGLLGGLVGQSGIGMALGTALTVLKAVNDPTSPVRELAAGFTAPTADA